MNPKFIRFSGNSLPNALHSATTLAYEDSFIILGGAGGGINDKILKYEKNGGQVAEVLTTLSEGKKELSAIKVNPTIFNSC